MLRRRIFHYLRFILMLGMGLIFGSLVGGIYSLNQSGVNSQWREKIAEELENLGVISDFESLRFEPTKGLVAQGVRVYTDDSRKDVVAQLEHLVIDVDKTKLMRGKIRVNKVSLKGAEISLPMDLNDPEGARVTMKDLRGDMYLPNKRTIEARKISGVVAGVQLTMDAHIWGNHTDSREHNELLKHTRTARLKLIARIIQGIEKWHWPAGNPPQLKVYLECSLHSPDSARLDFSLQADTLERDGVALRDVNIQGDYKNKLVTLDRVSFDDGTGKIIARADYHPTLREGRFQADSTLHLQMLARKLFGINIMQQLTFSIPPTINCTGRVNFDEKFKPDIRITGQAMMNDFSCLGTRFKHLKTDFSSHGGNAFLTGLHATHAEGEFKGRILVKDEIIRYQADSTLPASAYAPFLRSGSLIEKTLSRASLTSGSNIHITAQGTMNRNDFTEWQASGHLEAENFTYNKTALRSLSGNYELNRLNSRFSNIYANFDYTDYLLRNKHGGPSSAHVSADTIAVDVPENVVRISNIRGIAWPAPIVRLFAPGVADHVEDYRFHRPPSLKASGTFDLRRSCEQTDFSIDVGSPGLMSYDFLNKPLSLSRLRARVRLLGKRVDVNNLSFRTFQGACSGKLVVYPSDEKATLYKGGIQWRRLHLKDIGSLYKFDNAEQGLLTGRIDFNGENDNLRKFNGKGSLALEKGHLFSVPMLGPISPLVGAVLGKKNPTEGKAEDASCSYVIKKGVVFSNDFLATTNALKFTGEGNIDLKEKRINLLVRMNARGLLGVLAFPLRPFMGLFQFNGTGDISAPNWHTTMFTNPARGKKDPIFRKPPKARMVRE